MNYKDYRKRLLAADKLLRQKTTTRQKFSSIRKLIKGIDPQIDKILVKISKTLNKIDKIKKRKVIDLTIEHLPDKTKEQKKRKKLLLLLLRNWKKLRREVRRVEKEIKKQQQPQQQDPLASKATSLGRIVAYAKGPLGAITVMAAIIALGIVILKSQSVKVVIKNEGCQTILPSVSIPISIPGLKLPDQPIPDGGKAIAELPPLKFVVDGSSGRAILFKAYGMKFNFQLQSAGTDVVFNGDSLLGKRTEIRLGSKSQHEVVLRCLKTLID